ncbi:MAG: polyphosphate kinase 1 [Chitinophagales bacterium]|nr:polyphosphate kinase 1 [Chitinophagales bacterium]
MGLSNEKYFNRDLSWLSFNSRVLDEAADPNNPLYERINFLAIYSNNLDEFFRVRVAHIKRLQKVDKEKLIKKLDTEPSKLLKSIHNIVHDQQERFGTVFRNSILKELLKNNVKLYRSNDQPKDLENISLKYFLSYIMAFLQPKLILDKPPFLENRKIYFLVGLQSLESEVTYAILNIPSDKISRFIPIDTENDLHEFCFLDDIIRVHLHRVFPGYSIQSCHSIKLNRDADLQIEDEYTGDLLNKIKKQLHKRKIGVPSRLLYDGAMPEKMRDFMQEKWDLSDDELAIGGRYHNFDDFFTFPNPLSPRLENEQWPGLSIPELDTTSSLFELIQKKDLLLHFPYHSYDYVLRLFNEAAVDPAVEEIYITIYRIAKNSVIGNALISAARNGKKVTCFVELKARFDEENNIIWAEEMKRAGIKILYSIPGLKVHAKVALIKKRINDKIEMYAFMGTGNFNEKTAGTYTDIALCTSNEEITNDLDRVLNFLLDGKKPKSIDQLLVSQFNMVDSFEELISNEIQNALIGKKARIRIKLNNLENKKMIRLLYKASNAGVHIDLIIRGICRLVPSVTGLSENITITRIVDRFLEHSRIFEFWNNGDPLYFSGSADWMTRNLYNRVEVIFPILDKSIQDQINTILNIHISDNTKSVFVDDQLQNIRKNDSGKKAVRSQYELYQYFKQLPEQLI